MDLILLLMIVSLCIIVYGILVLPQIIEKVFEWEEENRLRHVVSIKKIWRRVEGF